MTAPALPLTPATDKAGNNNANVFGFLRWLFNRPTAPQLTEAEMAEIAEKARIEKELTALSQQLMNEAAMCASIISATLHDLGISFVEQRERRKIIRYVKFEQPYTYNEEALCLHFDLRPGKRPSGVTIAQLENPDTVRELSNAVGRKITIRDTITDGLFCFIWRNVGARGVPLHVTFDQMLALRPSGADRYSLPFGMGEGKSIWWRSLTDEQGVLVSGVTGGGKSNFLRAQLTALAYFCRPEDIQFCLADFKLVEFSFFKKLPHIAMMKDGRPAYVNSVDDFYELLEYMEGEMQRRMRLFEEAGVNEISEYNRHRRVGRLPVILLAVDEIANVLLSKLKGKALELLTNLASMGRAMGFRFMFGTQYPSKEVIEGRLKAVLPTIVAFRQRTMAGSVMVVGSKAANELSEKGRAVVQFISEKEDYEIQTPLLEPEQCRFIMASILAGKKYVPDSAAHDVTFQAIVDWAKDKNSNKLDNRAIVEQFAPRGLSQRSAQDIVTAHHYCSVIADGEEYVVVPGAAGIPTRLVLRTDLPPELEAEVREEENLMPVIEPEPIETVTADAPSLETPDAPAEQADDAPSWNSIPAVTTFPEDVEIFNWVVTENHLRMTRDDLYQKYRHRGMSFAAYKDWLQAHVGKTVIVGTKPYMVMAGSKGGKRSLPARLEPIELPTESAFEKQLREHLEPELPASN